MGPSDREEREPGHPIFNLPVPPGVDDFVFESGAVANSHMASTEIENTSVQEIEFFYRDHLSENGWKSDAPYEKESSTLVVFEKGTAIITVMMEAMSSKISLDVAYMEREYTPKEFDALIR